MTGEGEHHAQALARHVKAALLHLRQAEGIAKLAGIDIYGGNEVARLIRAAGEATEDLDLWAINNARGHGADPKETYRQTERWCHAPGGELPGNDLAHGMLAPDAVATYAAMLETTDPDPAGRAELRRELAQLTAGRQAWEETARACTCPPGLCSRREFRNHTGETDPSGCVVCADPDQPCYAAVVRGLRDRAGQ